MKIKTILAKHKQSLVSLFAKSLIGSKMIFCNKVVFIGEIVSLRKFKYHSTLCMEVNHILGCICPKTYHNSKDFIICPFRILRLKVIGTIQIY